MKLRVIDRYMVREVGMYAGIGIGVLAFLLVMGKMIGDGLELIAIGQMGLGMLGSQVFFLMSFVMAYALPLGLVSGILLVLGRMSSQREIVAMKACGVSLGEISRGVWMVVVLGGILTMGIHLYYGPMAKRQYKETIINVLRNNPLLFIKERVFIKDFPGYVIYIGQKKGMQLEDFWIWELDEKKRGTVFLRAERGLFKFDEESGDLLLKLYDGAGEKRMGVDPELFGEGQQPLLSFKEMGLRLPTGGILKKRGWVPKVGNYSMGELIGKMREEKTTGGDWVLLNVELQRRIAMGVSIFVLGLLAIPLGIKASRAETYANLGIGMVMYLVYYVMMLCVGIMEDWPGMRPDIWVWLPNVIYGIVGWRMYRYAEEH